MTLGLYAPPADLDLRSLGAALRRRKYWIIVPTLLAGLATGVVVNMIAPRYKSEARIVYDGRENVFLRPEVGGVKPEQGPADVETLTNQVQIVLSRRLAVDVIAELKLNELPEFDPLLVELSAPRRALILTGLSHDLYAMTPEERVLEAWNEGLSAYALDKSRVIVIEFQSRDSTLAASITNAIAAAYLRLQQEARQEQTKGAGQWLEGEIENLRHKVAEAEAKADGFRSRTDLFVGTNNTTLTNQQLGELNSQLVTARGQKADAETRARILRDQLGRGDPIEASDVVNSDLIRRLSEQRVTLRAQLAEQSLTLLGGHPRIKELKAQIDDLDRQIRGEADKIIRALDGESRIAGGRLDAISANLGSLKVQAANTNEQDVQFRALEREAKAQRDLLESYLLRYRETVARELIGSAPADARVISSAIVSNTPSFPKKAPIIAVATLVAFILSAGLVTSGELLSAGAAPGRRREPDDASPVSRRQPARKTVKAVAYHAPEVTAPSAPAEPFGAIPLRAAIMDDEYVSLDGTEATPAGADPGLVVEDIDSIARRIAEDQSGAIVMVSAIPSLPTSALALTLARRLAEDDDVRVALVGLVREAPDLRSASMWPGMPGVSDVVVGATSFGHILGKDKLSRAHLIQRGQADLTLGEMLSSRGFTVLIKALGRAYGHILFDAGYLNGDALRLAAIAPRCLLVTDEPVLPATANIVQILARAGFADISLVTIPHGEATTASGDMAA